MTTTRRNEDKHGAHSQRHARLCAGHPRGAVTQVPRHWRDVLAWMAGTSPAMTRIVVQAPLADAKPSAALADQVKSLDWRLRKSKKKGAATKAEAALAKARALLQ